MILAFSLARKPGPKGNIHLAAYRKFFFNKKITKIDEAVPELQRDFRNV